MSKLVRRSTWKPAFLSEFPACLITNRHQKNKDNLCFVFYGYVFMIAFLVTSWFWNAEVYLLFLKFIILRNWLVNWVIMSRCSSLRLKNRRSVEKLFRKFLKIYRNFCECLFLLPRDVIEFQNFQLCKF